MLCAVLAPLRLTISLRSTGMQKWLWVLCTVLLSLAGCSREESTDASANEPVTRGANGSRVADDNIFSEKVKALEKAEAVEKAMDDAQGKQREALEQQQ